MRILISDPRVRLAADRMVDLTYKMRDAEDTRETVTAARLAAVQAHDAYVDAVAAYLQTAH